MGRSFDLPQINLNCLRLRENGAVFYVVKFGKILYNEKQKTNWGNNYGIYSCGGKLRLS